VLQLLLIPLPFYLGSHLSPLRSWECVNGAQDEHLLPTLNGWTNREGELGDPTIPKELCGGGSTRLGGPFGLIKFCYNNSEHSTTGATPFQMVTGKSPIVPTTWVGQPPSDVSEEVPMVT
jgi:hypothetical protein